VICGVQADPYVCELVGLLYNEAQQDAKVAQTTLRYILTVHRDEEICVVKYGCVCVYVSAIKQNHLIIMT